MAFTFCTSGAMISKAGDGVNTNFSASLAKISFISDEVENTINMQVKEDLIANYATLDANTKGVLAEAASCLGAIYLIAYDMGGYTSRGEAETMINVYRDAANRAIKLIKEEQERL